VGTQTRKGKGGNKRRREKYVLYDVLNREMVDVGRVGEIGGLVRPPKDASSVEC
jgi:hypothetical protein